MILINSHEILTDSQTVSYNLVNPHLMYDSIPSSEAVIPGIPAGKQNRAIFQYWEEPQAGWRPPELMYQHFFGGELIKEGYFLLTEASKEAGYRGVYSDRLGLFFGDFQNTSLRQIDFGTRARTANPYPWEEDANGLVVCYPAIPNDRFWGPGTSALINPFAGNLSSYTYDLALGPIVPCFSVVYVLKKIAEVTGVEISGDFFDHPTWNKLIFFNLKESQTHSIRVRDHLPDMSVVDLFLELRKVANLKYDFDTVRKTLKIGFWEDVLTSGERIDWSKKATLGEVKTPEQNNRISFSMQVDQNDAIAKESPSWNWGYWVYPTSLGEYISPNNDGLGGIASIQMKFSTLAKSAFYGNEACFQEGQSSVNGFDTKPWAPRLLFWKGMESSGTYPRASNELDLISLTPRIIGERVWKETVALRNRSFYLQKELILNEADLARLDFGKIYHVNGVDYLLAQVNISVPIKAPAQALLIGGV